MDITIGTPDKIMCIMTKLVVAQFPDNASEQRSMASAIVTGIVYSLSAAFVSEGESETVVLIWGMDRNAAQILSHEADHITLNRIDEREASKKLDLLVALGRGLW